MFKMGFAEQNEFCESEQQRERGRERERETLKIHLTCIGMT